MSAATERDANAGNSPGAPNPLRLSVVIVTWNRPNYVRECLAHLGRQTRSVHEIVVVDASSDDQTRIACVAPAVHYVRFPGGAGHMTAARNEGLRHVSGDVVAFLDDDAYPAPGWHVNLVSGFEDDRVGAAAGRTVNGIPGEEEAASHQIGRLLPDGTLTANFAADPGDPVAIDHGIGANMAFRTGILAELGGFRDDFPGTALREDTDIFLRVRALGAISLFCPQAVARHVAAPHVTGRRFDRRYQFWARHNHMRLLARNLGLASPPVRRWIRTQVHEDFCSAHGSASENPLRVAARLLLNLTAIASGCAWAVFGARSIPTDPRRTDARGNDLRILLRSVTAKAAR